MLGRFWQGLQSMLQESSLAAVNMAPLPVCDVAVSDPVRILELLHLLESDRHSLSLQSSEGQGLGSARVFAVTQSQVTLQCSTGLDQAGDVPVNVIGASSRGAVMFTLRLIPTRMGDLWRAVLPDEVLCVQSRQHRRVEVVHSLGHKVELITAHPGAVRRVLDLSESGAALDVHGSASTPWADGPVVLKLDGVKIHVPRLEIVHTRALPEGHLRAGVRLADLRSDDSRHLRRWLNEAETALLTPLS
jgi:hypothetical protein